MKLFHSILYLLIVLIFSNCKQSLSSISDIPIEWEYADSEQYEPLSFLGDKEFKAIDANKVHLLSQFVPNEKGYIWLRGFFNYNSSNEPISILMEKIVWAEQVYLNGHYLGGTIQREKEQWNYWNLYRNYPIAKDSLIDGKNEILLRVYVESEGSVPDRIMVGPRVADRKSVV